MSGPPAPRNGTATGASPGFLWYDLETWGKDPRCDRIAQFAAQRTDLDLRPLEPPLVLWLRPPRDALPSPAAAAVTGLDPWRLDRQGLPEAEAIARIHAAMTLPGTCAAGWNTLRFDDEFIRHAFYRNFFDPYQREWKDGNSRWDLLDFARLLHALRPEGIHWPRREDGAPSFRLEHLAAANGIGHTHAHDAMSDVEATVGLARLFRSRQPRLWDYHLGLRDKRRVEELLAPGTLLLHVSSRFPASRHCAGIVLPLMRHPRNRNQVLVVELSAPIEAWLDRPAEELRRLLFTPAAELGDAAPNRPPIKAVHLNRSPALVRMHHVRAAEWQRLGLDPAAARQRAERLQAVAEELCGRLREVFATEPERAPQEDVDAALYADLPCREDEPLRQQVHGLAPERLGSLHGRFRDPRSDELLFRYRARNWPHTLTAEERARWRQHLHRRLDAAALQAFDAELAALEGSIDPALKTALVGWRDHLLREAGAG